MKSRSLPVLNDLNQVQVNSPCPENWDLMDGDDQKRFCRHCRKHVHNVEAMDATEFRELLSANDKICIRIKRDRHGNIVTKADEQDRRNWLGQIVATMVGMFSALVLGCSPEQGEPVIGKHSAPHDWGSQILGEVVPEMIETNTDDAESVTGIVDQESELVSLEGTEWKCLGSEFVFENEGLESYRIEPVAERKVPHCFGCYVEFKNGKFKSYNSTLCGNDLHVTVTGTFVEQAKGQYAVTVEKIVRDNMGAVTEKTPQFKIGVFQLRRFKESGECILERIQTPNEDSN